MDESKSDRVINRDRVITSKNTLNVATADYNSGITPTYLTWCSSIDVFKKIRKRLRWNRSNRETRSGSNLKVVGIRSSLCVDVHSEEL